LNVDERYISTVTDTTMACDSVKALQNEYVRQLHGRRGLSGGKLYTGA